MFRWTQLFLGAMGLIALMRTAFFIWGMKVFPIINEYGLYSHIGVNLAKKQDLIFHVGGILALCLYFFCAFLSLRSQLFMPEVKSSFQVVCICSSSLIVFLVLCIQFCSEITSWLIEHFTERICQSSNIIGIDCISH